MFHGLAGEGAFAYRGLRPQHLLHGLVPLSAGLVHTLAHGLQIDDGTTEAGNGVIFRNVFRFQPTAECVSPLLRLLGGLLCLHKILLLLLCFPRIQMSQFCLQKRFLLRQGVHLGQSLFEGLFQVPGIFDLQAHFRQFCFQRRDLTGFIMTAAVELLFQNFRGFGEGRILFAGRDEGGNPPFQTGVLTDGQPALPDKGAALIDFPADPQ